MKFITLLKKKNFKNASWLYLMQIFNTVIPLIVLPYITRILGAEKYGTFSIALNMVGYFQCIVEYGFNMSATRKVAISNKDGKKELNFLFANVIFSRLFLFIFCLIITLVYVLFKGLNEESICLIILDFMTLGTVLNLDWLFQGKQNMKLIAVSSIIARLLSTVLIFIFVKKKEDIFLYCILYAIVPIISGSISIVFAHRNYGVHLIFTQYKNVLNELKDGWYVFTTQISSKIFGAIGVTFLGMFATSTEVGIYSAVYKIPYILLMLWNPINQILYPISSKKLSDSYTVGCQYVYKLRKYMLFLFGIIAVMVGLFSKSIIMIVYGAEYMSGYLLIYPLLLWVLAGINNNFLGVQLMLGSGHAKEYSRCFQTGVVLTIIVNFVFIFLFKMVGAAIAPVVSELALGFLLYRKVKKMRGEER